MPVVSIDDLNRQMASPVPASPNAPTVADVRTRAQELGINPDLAASILTQESGGNFGVRDSSPGAIGGMQVMPATADFVNQRLGTHLDPGNPWDNMELGLQYLRYGKQKLGTSDPRLLAAGYHQGYNRPELQQGRIADTSDGSISTPQYADDVASRISPSRPSGARDPNAEYLQSLEAQGLTFTEPDLSAPGAVNSQAAGGSVQMPTMQGTSLPKQLADPNAGYLRALKAQGLTLVAPKPSSEQTPQAKPAQQASPGTLSGLAGDTGKLFKVGSDQLVQGVRELVRKIPGVGESVVGALDKVDQTLNGEPTDQLLNDDIKQMTQSLSPEMQAAMKKNFFDKNGRFGIFGSAWSDPRAYLGGIAESLPAEIVSILPAVRIAKGIYAGALAKNLAAGMAESDAAAAAAKTAAWASGVVGGTAEGAIQGGQSSQQVRSDIMSMPIDELRKSDAFNTLVKSGMSEDAARKSLAESASTQAMALSGIATGVFSGLGDSVLGKALTHGLEGGLVKRILKGAAAEGPLEEFPQSYLSQVAQNYAEKKANPDIPLTQGAMEQGLQGLAVGSAQGGMMTGAFGHRANVAENAPVPASEVLGQETSAPAESQPSETSAPGVAPVEKLTAPAIQPALGESESSQQQGSTPSVVATPAQVQPSQQPVSKPVTASAPAAPTAPEQAITVAQPKTSSAEPATIAGGKVADLSDAFLRYAATRGNEQAKQAASRELASRTQARNSGPQPQDQEWIGKLLAGKPLDAAEGSRAVQLGFGVPIGDGKLRVTRAARDYQKSIGQDLRSRVVAQVRSATPEEVPFSRVVPSKQSGLPVERIKSVVRLATAKWHNKPDIHVVQSAREVPDDAAPSDTEGVYLGNGQIYLVAENLHTPQLVREVLAHEAVGHHGFEQVFGMSFDDLADAVKRAEDRGDAAVIRSAARVDRVQPRLSRIDRAKEIVAVMAENGEHHAIALRLLGGLRRFLRSIGMRLELSTSDLVAYLNQAERHLREGRPSSRIEPAISPLYQRAFHGSPHRGIEQEGFRLNKIGTGEGAQAYGWGIYFAKLRDIAEYYRKVVSGTSIGAGEVMVHGKPLADQHGWLATHIRNIITQMQRGTSLSDAKKESIETLRARLDGDTRYGRTARDKEIHAAIDTIEKLGEHDFGISTGQLYSAEIPEDSDLLDWDKPLSEQSEKVKRAIETAPWDSSIKDWVRRAEKENLPASALYGFLSHAGLNGDVSARAASKRLESIGIPGLRYLDAGSRVNSGWKIIPASESVSGKWVVSQFGGANASRFDTEAEAKSYLAKKQSEASHNYVIWDEAHLGNQVQAHYSRADSRTPSREKHSAAASVGLSVARGAVSATRPAGAVFDITNQALESVGKALFAPVTPLTSRLYDRLRDATSNFMHSGPIRSRIAHGVVADYGLPEPYLVARHERERAVNAELRKSKELLEEIAGLDRSEARIAYLWMQEKPVKGQESKLLTQLPQAAQETLARMKDMIDRLGAEAVKLELLTPESYERNRMAYLHRSYKKYELDDPVAVARTVRSKTIRAQSYMGRGLRDDMAAARLPDARQGEKYMRFELRAAPEEKGSIGELRRVVYVKQGEPVPERYSDWRYDGLWEARWFDKKGQIGMWRDLTKKEREALGEIEEVRYAFARTMIAAVHDIETARFLKWIAENHAKADESEVTAAGGKLAEAVDSLVTLSSYADDEWVQVPAGNITGTKIRRYGALAGKFIPGHMWNDIRSLINTRSTSMVWRLYDQLLKAWKISKTALSPVVHTNNVLSNFVLADLADVSANDMRRALTLLIDAKRGKADAKTLLDRYYESGAEGGSFVGNELRDDVIEPILNDLQGEQNELLARLSLVQAIQLAWKRSPAEALAAFRAKRGVQFASLPLKAMINLYRREDSVFRLAKFLKEIDSGKTDFDAGRAARRSFLDYSINAPWIQALRRGPLPFLAFTYRVAPLLIEAAAKRPWKMMKYFAVGYALNALAYAMLGAAGDEERERELLPDEKSGNIFGVFPRLLRMPWNDAHGSPVFLDVRRWVPGGDIVDLTGGHGVLPMPSWLSVGGPIGLLIELASNKDMYTGKPILLETDTAAEKAAKLSDYLFKFLAPNVPLPDPPGYAIGFPYGDTRLFQTYSWNAIQNAGNGVTDAFGREKSMRQAILSAFGVKLGSYPADVGIRNAREERDAKLREINIEASRTRREYTRHGISSAQFQQRMKRQADKRQEVQREFLDKISH